MSRRPLLEVIALTAEDALAAQAGGADRLEVVSDMAADGLTPERETFLAIRGAVGMPLRVMLRSGEGFSLPDAAALDALCERAQRLRDAGATEFVFGFLDGDGEPDIHAVSALADAVSGCHWTFHRAIDRAADRGRLRARLAGLPGLDTYLTAGSAHGVDQGIEVLRAEAVRAAHGEPGYRARTLVGGGLRLEHLPLLHGAGIDAFHIGGAVRPEGWAAPVDSEAVREWRDALDAAAER